jgi:hypothetical protein
MPKLSMVFVLIVTASCSGLKCGDDTAKALKRIDTAVSASAEPQMSKQKYIEMVADARHKLDAMQSCLPPNELNGEFNEHLRNAVIDYDEATGVWGSGNNPQLKQYWQQAHEELDKIK